jgi:hypothetical protein
MAKSLTEGTLKIASGGALGSIGKSVPPNKGFFGEN